MKRTTLLIASIISGLVFGQMGMSNFQSLEEQEVKRIETNFHANHLRLYPIKAKASYHKAYEKVEDFVNLETALKNNWITISEVSSSGTVNTLIVKNNSNKNIYGLSGEVVMGGKQDRILGKDLKLAPGEVKEVPVFCVEHGRWSPQENGNQFTGYYNVTNNEVRKAAVVNKNQQQVWSEVEKVVDKNNAKTSTGTYTSLKNNGDYQAQFNQYYSKLKDSWKNDKDVIGVIAVSGDKVIGCDIFATHSLFNNSFNNLLHAYISTAITNGSAVTISYAEVQDYLKGFLGAVNPTAGLQNKGEKYEFNNTTYHLNAF